MKLTNKLGLHDALVYAIQAQDKAWYGGHGEERFASVTELLKPPTMVALERKHKDELEEDVSDCTYKLLGSAVHVALAGLIGTSPDAIAETRFRTEFAGEVITGGPDVIWCGGEIIDIKNTSAWKIVFGKQQDGLAEWTAQLNLYAEMARREGHDIRKLSAVVLLRDWDWRKVAPGSDYPRQKDFTLPIALWPSERVVAFAEGRVALFKKAFDSPAEYSASCTKAEVWQSPTTWALKKAGRKSAVKVFKPLGDETDEALEARSRAHQDLSKPGFSLEKRPAERRRCLKYCTVSKFCEEWKAYQKSTRKS